MSIKNTIKSFAIIPLIAVCLLSLSACSDLPHITEFSDVKDYGTIKGNGFFNGDLHARKEFFKFFPKKLDPSFEEVRYHYKAVDNLAFAFEATLEFRISDPAGFNTYVRSIAPIEQFSVFPYDGKYLEYVPEENELILWEPDPEHLEPGEGEEFYRIENAWIGRVLIDPSEQRVLYFLMVVEDDYYTNTSDLCDFFQRFNIDPLEMSNRLEA